MILVDIVYYTESAFKRNKIIVGAKFKEGYGKPNHFYLIKSFLFLRFSIEKSGKSLKKGNGDILLQFLFHVPRPISATMITRGRK